MGDTWQYRVRVTGPERDKFAAFTREREWGTQRDHDADGRTMFDWSGVKYRSSFAKDGSYPISAIWLNALLIETTDCVELHGNFSAGPGVFFKKKGEKGTEDDESDPFRRVGPGLFDHLDINVEIVGWSYSCDSPPDSIYSYRMLLERGAVTLDESEPTLRIAEVHAPEVMREFPDEHAEQRAKDKREDEELRARDPVPMELRCPKCKKPHVDRGEWTTKKHRTHLCEHCGQKWRPYQYPTVGVEHAAKPSRRPARERCSHGVTYEEEGKDNGCPNCATELRSYIDGLRRGVQ